MKQPNKYVIFSAEEINRQIDEVLRVCEKETDYKKIIRAVNTIFYNRLIPVITLGEELPSVKVYRVSQYPGINPDNVLSYSYPPPEKTQQGRANLEGYPVFYAAFNPTAALREMKEKLLSKETMYLSEWEIKFDRKIYAYSLLLNSNTLIPGLFPFKMVDTQLNFFLEALKNPTEEVKNGLKQFLIRTGDLFAMPGSKYYHITSAIAHQVLYDFKIQNAEVSMIMYPALESKHNGINYAIHPDFVNSGMMRCTKVIELKVTNIHETGIDSKVKRTGIASKNGEIKWGKPFAKINKIEYDKVIIYTYDETILQGETALSKKVIGSEKTLGEYLNQVLPEIVLDEIFSTSSKTDFFDFDIVREKQTGIFELSHGVQIETPKGQSCVRFIIVPIEWSIGNYMCS